MKYTIKIQKNRLFHLPLKIKNNIKSEGLNKVEWILNYNNNTVQMNFLKDMGTHQDDILGDIRKLYRNIYTQSMIKIPNMIYDYLNCQTLDYIILDVKDNYILVNTQKRIELSDISALIKKSRGEY
ncbi:MAG: hypothetical protein E7Z86_06510 [Methanosphaera stadtmanae]|nr:hypothetical protein [Methanosphaera stadtmanae]